MKKIPGDLLKKPGKIMEIWNFVSLKKWEPCLYSVHLLLFRGRWALEFRYFVKFSESIAL